MIQEIVNFVDYLEQNSPDIFSENLELKEGIYVFLEKEGEELVVKDENVLKVDKKQGLSGATNLYDVFKKYIYLSQMIPDANKNYLGRRGAFMRIDTPYGISCNKLSYNEKKKKEKLENELKLYFNAATKYCTLNGENQKKYLDEFKNFVYSKLDEILNVYFAKIKNNIYFYFFYKTDNFAHFRNAQENYYSERMFNNNDYNIPKTPKGIFPAENTLGITNSLNGYNSGKPFLKHTTGLTEFNKRITLQQALKIYSFFRLQKGNSLPNPFPLFVDEQELTEEAVTFYKKNNNKVGHKEIIEELIKKKKGDLQKYYLIYFNNKEKGSRIIDLDFVPVFRYKVDDIKLKEPFSIGGKFKTLPISNVFEFQYNILNKIFNGQLVTKTKTGGLWIKYFDDMDVKPDYGATDTMVDLFYMYRKSIYDYIYKSKRQAITNKMFQNMISKSILDDIKHDKEYKKEFSIKEKLNIWFSLYNYFANSNNKIDMVNKTQELLEKLKKIGKSENNTEFINTDEEFAFAAGQLIRTILNKSQSGERSHALLEPFLQKTQCDKLKLAIARAFDTYKHEFKFYRGDSNRYDFDKVMSNVMGYETKTNMKNLLPLILAGYFSESIFKIDKELEQEN